MNNIRKICMNNFNKRTFNLKCDYGTTSLQIHCALTINFSKFINPFLHVILFRHCSDKSHLLLLYLAYFVVTNITRCTDVTRNCYQCHPYIWLYIACISNIIRAVFALITIQSGPPVNNYQVVETHHESRITINTHVHRRSMWFFVKLSTVCIIVCM